MAFPTRGGCVVTPDEVIDDILTRWHEISPQLEPDELAQVTYVLVSQFDVEYKAAKFKAYDS